MDTFTNSEYSRCQKLTEVVLSQPPEADANTNTGEDNGANLVPEVIEGQDEKPPDPQPIQTSYRAISTIRFAVLLGYIIAGNCLCSGILCLTLWGFSKVEDLVPWQKRGFNAISLLLSGVLGFGIGFLLDQIGLLARGSILQRKSHSVKEIGYIMMGTLSSYALLYIHQIRTRRGFAAPTTWVLLLFVFCSVVGRFGVAFIGFAFTLEETPLYTPQLLRPNWVNGTIGQGGLSNTALTTEGDKVEMGSYSSAIGQLCETAQLVKGRPWLIYNVLDHSPLDANRPRTRLTPLSDFASVNFTMQVSGRHKISFLYKFMDFRGSSAVFAQWEALLETSCRRLDTIQNIYIPVGTINITEYPPPTNAAFLGSSRWISFLSMKGDGSPLARDDTIELWLVTWFAERDDSNVSGRRIVGNATGLIPVLFNCSVYFVDSPTDSRPVPSLDIYESGVPRKEHIMGSYMHGLLRESPAISRDIRFFHRTEYNYEAFRDFYPAGELLNAMEHEDQSAAELWLASYLGNYIGNCLSFLNDILDRVEVETEKNRINTKLLVNWGRVAITLGGLAAFQVLLGLAALLYCRENFEIVDDVATFSSMFTDLPLSSQEEGQKEGAVHQGRFVAEGEGFRWVCFGRVSMDTGVGQEIKAA